jgi:hypothetical protein
VLAAISGHSAVAIGSRLASGADVARRLVPKVHGDGWFFDTEPGMAHISSRGIHEGS